MNSQRRQKAGGWRQGCEPQADQGRAKRHGARGPRRLWRFTVGHLPAAGFEDPQACAAIGALSAAQRRCGRPTCRSLCRCGRPQPVPSSKATTPWDFGIFVRAGRALREQPAAARAIRRGLRTGRARGPRSVPQGAQSRHCRPIPRNVKARPCGRSRPLFCQPFVGGKSRENTGWLRNLVGSIVQNWLTL